MATEDRGTGSVASNGSVVANGSQKEGNMAESKVRSAGQRAAQAALKRGQQAQQKKENAPMANSNSTEWKFNAAEWPAISARIEALKKVDAEGYKSLEVREWYSIKQAAYIIGQGTQWLRKQLINKADKQGNLYFQTGQTKRAKMASPTGEGSIEMWLIRIDAVQERMMHFLAVAAKKEAVRNNPKAHIRSNNYQPRKSLLEQVAEMTPEEKEQLKKLLG